MLNDQGIQAMVVTHERSIVGFCSNIWLETRHSSIMLNHASSNVTGRVTVLSQRGNDANLQSMQDKELQILVALACLYCIMFARCKVFCPLWWNCGLCTSCCSVQKRKWCKKTAYKVTITSFNFFNPFSRFAHREPEPLWSMIAGEAMAMQPEAWAWRRNCMKLEVHCEMRRSMLNSWKQGCQPLCKKQLTQKKNWMQLRKRTRDWRLKWSMQKNWPKTQLLQKRTCEPPLIYTWPSVRLGYLLLFFKYYAFTVACRHSFPARLKVGHEERNSAGQTNKVVMMSNSTCIRKQNASPWMLAWLLNAQTPELEK